MLSLSTMLAVAVTGLICDLALPFQFFGAQGRLFPILRVAGAVDCLESSLPTIANDAELGNCSFQYIETRFVIDTNIKPANFSEAWNACEDRGLTLALPTTPEESQLLITLTEGSEEFEKGFYIGAWQSRDGLWLSTEHNIPLDYFDWDDGQPNGLGPWFPESDQGDQRNVLVVAGVYPYWRPWSWHDRAPTHPAGAVVCQPKSCAFRCKEAPSNSYNSTGVHVFTLDQRASTCQAIDTTFSTFEPPPSIECSIGSCMPPNSTDLAPNVQLDASCYSPSNPHIPSSSVSDGYYVLLSPQVPSSSSVFQARGQCRRIGMDLALPRNNEQLYKVRDGQKPLG